MVKHDLKFNNNELIELFRQMLLIRRFEEKVGQLYGMGLIGGFCHLYIGQEAVAVGVQSNLQKGDAVITSYRDHGLMLAAGSDPMEVLGELMGRSNGCSKGKGGSMHMFDLENGFYGGHGIVGAPVSLGTGIAFAQQYKDTKNICATYYGDGAANQGQVYESLNMAGLWKLPVLYIIENNEYAMGTSVARSSASSELFKRGEPFNIPGEQVDGMEVLAVAKAAKKAIDYIRSGKGPYILEMKTYRYRGHSMSDPAKYRSKEEVSDIKETRDPIANFKQYLIKKKIASDEELTKIDKKIRDDVAKMVEICKESEEPDADELWTDVLIGQEK